MTDEELRALWFKFARTDKHDFMFAFGRAAYAAGMEAAAKVCDDVGESDDPDDDNCARQVRSIAAAIRRRKGQA